MIAEFLGLLLSSRVSCVAEGVAWDVSGGV